MLFNRLRYVVALSMLGALTVVASSSGVFVSRPVVAASASQEKKMKDAILGVSVGTHIDEVHAKLKSLGTVGGRATRDGGRKEAWTLKKTEYSSIAYKTDARGHVVWVTGFVRPGKEMAFTKFGDLSQALRNTHDEVVWNVNRPEGNFRLMATGTQGKARLVQMVALVMPSK